MPDSACEPKRFEVALFDFGGMHGILVEADPAGSMQELKRLTSP
jgi:hypothetical protein